METGLSSLAIAFGALVGAAARPANPYLGSHGEGCGARFGTFVHFFASNNLTWKCFFGINNISELSPTSPTREAQLAWPVERFERRDGQILMKPCGSKHAGFDISAQIFLGWRAPSRKRSPSGRTLFHSHPGGEPDDRERRGRLGDSGLFSDVRMGKMADLDWAGAWVWREMRMPATDSGSA